MVGLGTGSALALAEALAAAVAHSESARDADDAAWPASRSGLLAS